MCGMVSWATCGTGKSRNCATEDNAPNQEQFNRLFLKEIGFFVTQNE